MSPESVSVGEEGEGSVLITTARSVLVLITSVRQLFGCGSELASLVTSVLTSGQQQHTDVQERE